MVKDKNIYSVEILPSIRKEKKYMAVFKNKDNKKIKTIHFGAAGFRDYTLLWDKKSPFYIDNEEGRKKVRTLYIDRHKKRENWALPDNAGSLSRWVLWNKPTLEGSIIDYKSKFKLK